MQRLYLSLETNKLGNERTWTDDVAVEAVKPVLYAITKVSGTFFLRLSLFFCLKFYRVFLFISSLPYPHLMVSEPQRGYFMDEQS